MNNYQSNPAFVSDDGNTKSRNSSLATVEMGDVNRNTNEKGDYSPYDNRKVEHPTTNLETLLHLLKGSLGTGILAMPSAFHHAGYGLGIGGTIVIGALCLYCVHLLINGQYELCKRKKIPSMSYPATMEAALAEGPPFLRRFTASAPHTVNGFLLVYQLGTCCVYVVFIATNMKNVMDQYIADYNIRLYMLVFLLPLILINWVRNLKYLAPFSTLANGITLVSFAIIIYYLFREVPNFEGKEPIGELADIPLFFGTVLFALEAIGVIMPLENEMKTPQSFGGRCGILNIGMITIIFLYVFMGFFGYLTYGKAVHDTITIDLEKTEVLAQVVKLTLALAIYITHALQCYVAVDITWNDYLGKRFDKNSRRLLWEYAIRTALVLATFLLAVAIPNLGMFISLFGAFCLSALGLAFPALIDMSTYYYSYTGRRFQWLMAKDCFLIIFALFGLIVGTYTSVSNIITELS